MEQGTRLDSTRMSAAQDVRDDTGPDHGLDAAVATLLTTQSANAVTSELDPMLAAIAEGRRLLQAYTHVHAFVPQDPTTPEPPPEWEAAGRLLWAHIDDVVLKTVPQTGAGCRELARFAEEYFEANEVSISDDEMAGYRLIAQSTLHDDEPSTVEAAAPIAASPALVSMVAEWERMLHIENYGDLSDEEADPIMHARLALHARICAFPVTSSADLFAKLPLYRDEMANVAPKGAEMLTLDYESWRCVVTDLYALGAGFAPIRARTSNSVHASTALNTAHEASAAQPIPADLATVCVDQIKRLDWWDANPDAVSEKQGAEEMDRWGAVFRRAIDEPSVGPRDLAGKAYMMLADLDRFEPEKADDKDNDRLMRVILREAIAMGGLVYKPAAIGQDEAVAVAAVGDASDRPVAAETALPDPVLALIERHRQAYAEWLPHLDMIGSLLLSSPEYTRAEAAGEPARVREADAYHAVITASPTTLSGFRLWAAYLSSPTMAASIDGVECDAGMALKAMCAAALVLLPISPSALPETGA